jgi:hypothetical protein
LAHFGARQTIRNPSNKSLPLCCGAAQKLNDAMLTEEKEKVKRRIGISPDS